MKRIYLILLLSVLSLISFAERPVSDSLRTDSTGGCNAIPDIIRSEKNAVTFQSEYFFGSNALTIDLASTYFNNGFINDGMKDVVSGKLKTSNNFGAGFNYELNYRRSPDSLFGTKFSYYQVGFRDVYHLDARFNRDVFELYFRGNKKYAGQTADIGDFEFKQLFYQQLYFTFGHQVMNNGDYISFDKDRFEYSVGLSFNKGHKLLTIEAIDASLFTQQDGEYLDLDADLEIHTNDSAKNDKIAFNGIGGSIDLYFKWTDKKCRQLEFTAKNLGLIAWNNQSSYVAADTSFRFEGVDISDLFDFTDSVTNTISLDSSLVEPYLTNRTKKSHNTLLPALIKLKYSLPVKKIKTIMSTEVGYLLYANCKPYIRQTFQYRINSVHSVGLSLSYGGYSNFNVGLNYELRLKNWNFQLKSDAITGYFMKDATSQGAFVSLSKYF